MQKVYIIGYWTTWETCAFTERQRSALAFQQPVQQAYAYIVLAYTWRCDVQGGVWVHERGAEPHIRADAPLLARQGRGGARPRGADSQ